MNPSPRAILCRLYAFTPWLMAAALFVGTAFPAHAKDPCKNHKQPAPSVLDTEEARSSSYAILQSAWKNQYAVGNLSEVSPNEACFWEFLKKQEVTNEDWDKYPAAARRYNRCWQGQEDKASAGCELWVKTRDSLKVFEQSIDQGSQDLAQLKTKYGELKKDYSGRRGTLKLLWFSEEGTLIKWLDHKKKIVDQKMSQALTRKAAKKIGETASIKSTKKLGDHLQLASNPSQQKGVLDQTFDQSSSRRPDMPGRTQGPASAPPGAAIGSGQGAGGALIAAGSKFEHGEGIREVPPVEKKEESKFPMGAAGTATGAVVVGGAAYLWKKTKEGAKQGAKLAESGIDKLMDLTSTPAYAGELPGSPESPTKAEPKPKDEKKPDWEWDTEVNKEFTEKVKNKETRYSIYDWTYKNANSYHQIPAGKQASYKRLMDKLIKAGWSKSTDFGD